MKPFKILFILLNFFLLSCENTTKKKVNHPESYKISDAELLKHVKLCINPAFEDWVLFQNGTYIIFDKADTIANLENEAIKSMKKFGPVYVGNPSGDFSITHLNKTEGWIVSGHGYGMYTYVNPNELTATKPEDHEIGLHGRSKRNLDGEKPIIIHVNRKKAN